MERKNNIYRKMLDAISDNAFFRYEFDVTTGIIDMPILSQNHVNFSDMLGLKEPFTFDEMIMRMDKMGFSAFHDGKIQHLTANRLIELYESGQHMCDMILRSNEPATYLYIQMSYLLAKNEKDGHIWAYVIARDISDIKIKEEQTARKRDQFIKEKDHQLELALQEAKDANEAKTNFLFNMSHDIRTPMNAIIGYTDLLEKSLDDKERAAEYVRKIQSANTFLLSLINNVLEMARIESGKMFLDEVFWNAQEFNDTIYCVFSENMKNKGITFTRSVQVEHNDVLCDATKVREIFLNLLGNALKYTPAGGMISMDLTEIPSTREGYAFYRTVITDNGIGMSKEFAEHIFDAFTRERTTTESKVEGSGLGMAIVKSLVELMEGTIEIESAIGNGTRITVVLPHRIANSADQMNVKDNAKDIVYPDFGGKRILLAEDNEMNAEIAAAILHEMGIKVDVAQDGVICVDMVEKAQSGFYDMILMDIQMPNLTGFEATARIRKMQDKRKANMPIIAMTANAFAEDRIAAKKAGMNGHLPKPINVKEMIGVLERYLGGK